MEKRKTITIDCAGLTMREFHQRMKDEFGFPSFYGMNQDALQDCLSYMRQPLAGMSKVRLSDDEVLRLNLINCSSAKFDLNTFKDIVKTVNKEELQRTKNPLISLELAP